MCCTTAMVIFRSFILIFVFIISVNGMSIGTDTIMQCSKYHFEERVLEKLIQLEFKMKNHENMMEKWTSDLKSGLDKIENLKEITETFMDVQKTEFDKTKENILHKIETVAEKLENQSMHQMALYDRRIETKLKEITGSEKERNSSIQMMRSELWSSFVSVINGYKKNISEMLTNQAQLAKDYKEITNKPRIAFAAYMISKSTKGIVKFPFMWTNVGNAYDTSTGVFTAPIPGLYMFTAVLLSENSKSLYRHIWKNNEPLAGTYVTDQGYKAGTLTVVLQLKKGDEVYVKSNTESHGDVYSDIDKFSTFTGYFIG